MREIHGAREPSDDDYLKQRDLATRDQARYKAAMRKLLGIYRALRKAQGHQGWWPAETPFEVAVGAVLAQNTSWRGAAQAVQNLKTAGLLDAARLDRMAVDRLAKHLVPAGYFNLKAKRLKSLIRFLVERCDGEPAALAAWDLGEARTALLEVWGLGPETADSILLYAAGHPVFVVDAYTRRIFSRLGLLDERLSYDDVRLFFEKRLPRDLDLYKDFHAQIVRLGSTICRPRPCCEECPIRSD